MTTERALSVWLRDDARRWDPPATLAASVLAIPSAGGNRVRPAPLRFAMAGFAVAALVAVVSVAMLIGSQLNRPALPPSNTQPAIIATATPPASSSPAASPTTPSTPPPTPGPTLHASPRPSASASPPPSPSSGPAAYRIGRVAYEQGNDIYVANADGSNKQPVTSANGGKSYSLATSGIAFPPRAWFDGRIFVFEQDRGQLGKYLLVNPQNQSQINLGSVSGPGYRAAAGAADGSRFVIETEPLLRIVGSDGTLLWNVPPPPGYDRWGITDVSALSISANGQTLIATACTDVCQKGSDPGQDDQFVIDLSGSEPVVMPLTPPGTQAWNARLSPDGLEVSYLVVPDAGWEAAQAWIVNRDGTGLHELGTPAGAVTGPWSPDSQHEAFVLWADQTQLGVADADGTSAVPMYSDTGMVTVGWDPNWSPDGRLLSRVLQDAAGDFSLSTYAPDGSASEVLFRSVPFGWNSDWEWVPNN